MLSVGRKEDKRPRGGGGSNAISYLAPNRATLTPTSAPFYRGQLYERVVLHLSEQENAWCDKDARYSWFPQCSQLSTPSPPRQAERGAPFSPRLMTTPVARHPLPQGGEGREFARTGHDHRNYHRPRRFRSLLRKCRNSSPRVPPVANDLRPLRGRHPSSTLTGPWEGRPSDPAVGP